MLKSLPWLIIILGGALAITGIVLALLEVSILYNGILDKPLDQPEGFEKKSADSMLHYAIVAAPGVILLFLGKIMLKRRHARRG